MMRIDPPPDALTLLRRGSLSTDQVLPLTEIGRCLSQFDIQLASIDVISTGARTASNGIVARLYDSITTGTLRTAIIATRRVANRERGRAGAHPRCRPGGLRGDAALARARRCAPDQLRDRPGTDRFPRVRRHLGDPEYEHHGHRAVAPRRAAVRAARGLPADHPGRAGALRHRGRAGRPAGGRSAAAAGTAVPRPARLSARPVHRARRRERLPRPARRAGRHRVADRGLWPADRRRRTRTGHRRAVDRRGHPAPRGDRQARPGSAGDPARDRVGRARGGAHRPAGGVAFDGRQRR
ncbi:type VII secretion protein EccE [Mycobacteroides abscessus subsp. abscessus]|nr:type VII secretion protein EccE [Mycobacteroides abscessus subsp. abscessus]